LTRFPAASLWPADGDDDQRVGHEDLVLQRQVFWRHGHDVEVVQVAAQAGDDVVAVEHFQRYVDLRVQLAKAAQQAGHKVFGGADHGNLEAPAGEAFGARHALLERIPLARNGTCSAGQCLARPR
jgi:hypothetical protein